MKNFDIDSFLNNSFKKLEKTKKENKMDIEERKDNLFENKIDNKIYSSLNMNSIEKYNNKNIDDILKPLFPNENIYNNEYNQDKNFILDKYIDSNKNKKNPKKIPKKNFSKNIIKNIKNDKTITYESMLEINNYWNEYIISLLNNSLNPENISQKLLKCDLHGSIISVFSSNNKNNIGLNGIVIYESKRTFNIITKKNSIKILLKMGNIFEIEIPNKNNKIIKAKIIGDNFLFRSAERTKIKYKPHYNLNKNHINLLSNLNI